MADAVAAYAAKATWPAGFVVYQRGASADGMFIVLQGRIVLRSRVKAGRAFVPALARAGETFGWEGLAPNARYATDARADASQDKRRAEYLAARERCDAYSGDAKDRCVSDAKNRFKMK